MGVQLPFPIDPQLTAIAVMYRNERLIADEVMPRVSVGQREFKSGWEVVAIDGVAHALEHALCIE